MMKNSRLLLVAPLALAFAGSAIAQPYPIVDRVAQKVIQKYQNASCQQLAQEKAQGANRPKSPAEQRAIQLLQQDASIRQAFLNQIAAPVLNKLFECGMVP